MYTLTQFKTLASCVLVCFAFLPQMHAAPNAYGVPPPDGCYPGFTTAEGCNALANLTTGAGNTGIGWYSLFFAGSSSFSTGVGAGALVLNGGDSNTAVGAAALLLNSTGTENTAVGVDAMVYNGTGQFNNLELTGAPLVPLVDGAIQTALLPLDREQRLTSPVTITGGNTVTIISGDPDTDVLYNKGLILGTGAGTFVPVALPKRGSFNTGDYAMVIDYRSNRSGLYRVTVLDAESSLLTLTFVWQSQEAAWGRLRSDPADPLPAWPDGCALVKLSPPVTYTVSADNRLVRMTGKSSRPPTRRTIQNAPS